MASLPASERRQIAKAAVTDALPLMASADPADTVTADSLLRHAVHQGAWATDVVQAAIDHARQEPQ